MKQAFLIAALSFSPLLPACEEHLEAFWEVDRASAKILSSDYNSPRRQDCDGESDSTANVRVEVTKNARSFVRGVRADLAVITETARPDGTLTPSVIVPEKISIEAWIPSWAAGGRVRITEIATGKLLGEGNL